MLAPKKDFRSWWCGQSTAGTDTRMEEPTRLAPKSAPPTQEGQRRGKKEQNVSGDIFFCSWWVSFLLIVDNQCLLHRIGTDIEKRAFFFFSLFFFFSPFFFFFFFASPRSFQAHALARFSCPQRDFSFFFRSFSFSPFFFFFVLFFFLTRLPDRCLSFCCSLWSPPRMASSTWQRVALRARPCLAAWS